MNEFEVPTEVGDRVFAVAPRNENWRADMHGTVIGVPSPGYIDILWDHGSTNYGHTASRFGIVR